MPKEIWGGVAGQTYAALNEEFANGNVVMYDSGSWQIGQFSKTIGDAFDWWAIPQPCGPAACSGLPGGAPWSRSTYTKHPAEVAKLMEWLASEPIMKEFAERTLFIPGHKARRREGPRLQDRQCERQARARRLRRGDRRNSRRSPSACRRYQVGRTRSMPPRSPAWARSSPARSRSTTPMPASPTTSQQKMAEANASDRADTAAKVGAGVCRPIAAEPAGWRVDLAAPCRRRRWRCSDAGRSTFRWRWLQRRAGLDRHGRRASSRRTC